jgi:hypothetical protein
VQKGARGRIIGQEGARGGKGSEVERFDRCVRVERDRGQKRKGLTEGKRKEKVKLSNRVQTRGVRGLRGMA